MSERVSRVRPYLALARTSAKAGLAYRLNFLLSLFALMFQLFAMLAIWNVLLGSGQVVGGFDWAQMKAYLLVGFVSGVLVSQSGEWNMVGRIQSGMVALDLTKPVNYQTARFADVVGAAWPEVLTGVVVCGGVLLFTGPAAAPPTPSAAILFGVSLLAILPLKFLIVYVTSLAAFHTQNYLGLHWARLAVVSILSGALVPLSFFPGWLQAVAAVLPFASLAATPGLIYLGHVDTLAAVRLIAIQFGWVLVLWVGAALIWRRAVTRVTIHGG